MRASGDLLKPDVIAPGTDVLAGVAPPGNSGKLFDLYSGTSMSSPHVAGLAALFKEIHPDWSPMMIKSALMTTGYDMLDTGIYDGHEDLPARRRSRRPRKAIDPGLVFNSGFNDWLAFLCGTTPVPSAATSCNALVGLGYSTDPSNLNVASIAIGDLAGTQTVTRTVTNVGTSPATYTRVVSGLAGINVTVYAVHADAESRARRSRSRLGSPYNGATPNVYTGGQLTWSDGTHDGAHPDGRASGRPWRPRRRCPATAHRCRTT